MTKKEVTIYVKISQNSLGMSEDICWRVPLSKTQTQVYRDRVSLQSKYKILKYIKTTTNSKLTLPMTPGTLYLLNRWYHWTILSKIHAYITCLTRECQFQCGMLLHTDCGVMMRG
jgi:hypothetical protein